jgi:hypothetical protein
MYLEEGEIPEEYIPREILRNNLYGIDIDSGAAQIAALSLYLKAKGESPDVTIPQLNIISADAVLINGNRKQEVLERARSRLEKEILEQIWRSFDNIREFGSLVRVEERIDEILENHKDAIQASGQVKFTQEGSFATQSSFVSEEGEKESWAQVKNRLLEEVAELASEALDRNDPIEEMFASEVGKTVELLDVLVHEYDVVVSNPPYLSSRKMGDSLKNFLKDNFTGYRNTYTCFIERCAEMSTHQGYASIVTPQDYMTLHSYRKLRDKLVTNHQIIEAAQLAGFSFSMKDRPFTIPLILRQNDPEEFHSSRFLRLTHEQDRYDTHEKTIEGLNDLTECIRNCGEHEDIYTVDQTSFKQIDKQPFVYWFGREILDLFADNKSLDNYAEVKTGLITSDDDRFLRKWWEVDKQKLNEQYIRFQKSGTDSIYYDIAQDYVNWEDDGKEIKNFEKSAVKNEAYYFSEGVTFRGFGKMFVARRHYNNMIHSDHAHLIYPEKLSESYVLGLLNSSLSRFITHGLSPGVNFTAGDGKQVPIKRDRKFEENIKELTNKAIQIKMKSHSLKEISSDFDPSFFLTNIENSITDLLYIEDIFESTILVIHGLIDQYVFSEYGLSSGTESNIYDNLPEDVSKYNHITNSGDIDKVPYDIEDNIEQETLPDTEYMDIRAEIKESPDAGLEKICESACVSPYTISNIRNDIGYTSDEKEEAAARVLSYYLGCSMGRWELNGMTQDSNEIIVFDENHSNNVMSNIRRCIDLTYDESETYDILNRFEELLNTEVKDWLRNKFFRHHHCKVYRRRGQRIPIYWQLESHEGTFSCFIYYHGIDQSTLPKLRGQYLDPRINKLENEFETLSTQISGENPDKELLNRKEKVQNDLDDIREFRDTIDDMIDDGLSINAEKGIWENIKNWDQYEVLETGLPKLKSSYSR